ncbi:unnamed protein product [Echinostoma caproni]|uniref:Uncharacterized protein n=1 Tax=Echinostoma caproni TaxID=27848 RepID=A0A183B728_9TREM|nr:unnamed protein product [Echinostoma caproni]
MNSTPLEFLDLNCSARDIEDYFERFEIWWLTRSKPDEGKKSAFFLNAARKNAHILIKNLDYPSPPVSLPYEDLKSLFLHVKSTNFEASMVRNPNQGIRKFIYDFLIQAVKCDFGNLLDMQLRDRLISGINNTVLQNELLKLSNPTFNDVPAHCEQYQDIRQLLHPCRRPSNLQLCSIHSKLNPRKFMQQPNISKQLHNLAHTM